MNWGCREAEGGVHEGCCLHDLPTNHARAPGQVCCWCGDIFQPRHEKGAKHGRFVSKSKARREAGR